MVLRMKRTLVLALAALAAVLGFAAPAQAATPGKMEFTRIVYNPLGRDTHAKLNQEYVRVTNHTSIDYRMTGWTIADAQGHKFTFPVGYRLRPGQVAIVHTGVGVKDQPHRGNLYWNSRWFIW